MVLLIHFFWFSYFFFVPFIFILYMKLSPWFCLFIYSDSAISFSYLLSLYYIWSWVKVFAYSFFIMQLFLSPILHLHIIYEVEPTFSLIHFYLFSYFFFLSLNFMYNIKSSQSFGLFILLYLAISFSCSSFSYIIGIWINLFAYWFSMNNLINLWSFNVILFIRLNIVLCVCLIFMIQSFGLLS